jgi:hypothetical protein
LKGLQLAIPIPIPNESHSSDNTLQQFKNPAQDAIRVALELRYAIDLYNQHRLSPRSSYPKIQY